MSVSEGQPALTPEAIAEAFETLARKLPNAATKSLLRALEAEFAREREARERDRRRAAMAETRQAWAEGQVRMAEMRQAWAEGQVRKLREALGAYRSALRSGEPESDRMRELARVALVGLPERRKE